MWRRISFQIIFIAFATALAGEIRIAPFGWEFRFGLGSSAFFFLLLIMRQVPYIKTGIITGFIVVVFRTLTSTVFLTDPSAFFDVFTIHISAMFYYIAFAFGLSKINKRYFTSNLFLLGAIVVFIDAGSNVVEISIRTILTETTPISVTSWLTTLLVAVVRVYFVIGLYANITLIQLKVIHKEQEKRLNQMLKFGSNLYSESFFLDKMLDTIEQITALSYAHYSKLQKNNLVEHSVHALTITEQIHEVKKDSQRILAGLTKLYDTKSLNEMDLSHIVRFVIQGNKDYSDWLQKDIVIKKEQSINFNTIHFFPIITILNNLTANSVEAIDKTGQITLRIYEEGNDTYFLIIDTGKGIRKKDLPLIFEAGFTTKYNDQGSAATGIGLLHVRNIIELLKGKISFEVTDEGTIATVIIPTDRIKKRSHKDAKLRNY